MSAINTRRQKAIKELVENGGSVGNAMRKAGYSPKTAKNPKKLTESKGFKEEVIPIVEAMIKERDEAIKLMGTKRGKASYRDLVDGTDKLTKNIQLLQGKETSKDGIVFKWEE